jgi:hypothetical protein
MVDSCRAGEDRGRILRRGQNRPADPAAYERFYSERLSGLPGVAHLAMKAVKADTGLPVT